MWQLLGIYMLIIFSVNIMADRHGRLEITGEFQAEPEVSAQVTFSVIIFGGIESPHPWRGFKLRKRMWYTFLN